MRPCSVNGFTLIEVLTVVIILGISASIIVPQFSTRDDLQTTAAARLVMGDLAYAQNHAIATQKKHYVEFNGSNYSLYARDSDGSAPYILTNPITGNAYTVALGVSNGDIAASQISSINFDGSTQKALQFDSLGLPSIYNATADTAISLASTGTITLTTTTGTFPTAITIDPSTGEATVAPAGSPQ